MNATQRVKADAAPPPSPPSTPPAPPGAFEEVPRVVVVDRDHLASRVTQALAARERGARVSAVPSFIAAIGELSHAPASAVVGSAEALGTIADSTVRAMRELSPGATLLAVAEAGDAHDAALAAGFDACLSPDADADELAAALGELEHEVMSPMNLTLTLPPPSMPAEGAALGDVDLVEAVLRNQPLRASALALLRQRWGVDEVALADDAASVGDDRIIAAVELGEASLGVLHAPSEVDEAELRAWAAWLARWLALEAHVTRLREMAFRDSLTGAYNRRYFDRFLDHALQQAHHRRQQVTLMVFDIDDFKLYNDRHGHAAGDEILREAVRLMRSAVRGHDVVARIGGDEFAVVFWDPEGPRERGSSHPDDVLAAARRFQKAIVTHEFPKLAQDAPATLTISAGLAGYPWDGRTPAELLEVADQMALQSKRQGKNAITFGPGAGAATGVHGTFAEASDHA